MYYEVKSRTSGNGRYCEHTLDDRLENKWDGFVSHTEKVGQIILRDDTFKNVGFSK